MMRRVSQLLFFLVFAFCQSTFAQETPAPHITIRHLSTTSINQGICSIRFGVESQPSEEAEDVEIQMSFVNQTGKTIYSATIHTSRDGSNAGLYSEELIEDKGICFDPSTKVIITKATAKIESKSYDLITLKRIKQDNFVPYAIRVGN